MRGRIVLATYNEAGSIRPVLAEVEEAIALLQRGDVEMDVLLVDDSSPDGTAAIALEEAAHLGIKLEVLSGKKAGLGKALLRGFAHSLATNPPDFFVTLDADGQHDARQIPDLVRAHIARRSGITIGSRWVRGGASPGTPPFRAVLSRTGNFLARAITGMRGVRDATTSFRVIQADVARLFSPDDLNVDGYGFFSAFVAITQASGFAIHEVPIVFRPRYSGVSKLTVRDMLDFFRNLFKVRAKVKVIRSDVRRDQTAWAARSPLFHGQGSSAETAFGGEAELKHLARADNFHDWIVDTFRSSLGTRILEVGAGIGTITRRLVREAPAATVVSLEPTQLFDQLRSTFEYEPRVTTHKLTCGDFSRAQPDARFDTVVYVNVLEHIENDLAELQFVQRMLEPGAALCAFVPAAPSIYGPLDYRSGHYRRYNRASLRQLVENAGFEIETLTYFDTAGLFPYWLTYRVMGTQRLSARQSQLYDNVVIPLSRTFQRIVRHPPAGKNLLLVARSPIR